MPITRLSTDIEHRSAPKIRQEPSKVAGINNKPRVETGGGGGGGGEGDEGGAGDRIVFDDTACGRVVLHNVAEILST